jgi:sec-independent protein translocase protein TatB
MFDIGGVELFIVGVLALVVVGPKELPKLLRTVGGFVRRIRELTAEFRAGVSDLAAEVEREVDPFADLREEEGLRPGMSPEEVTEHILANREAEEAATANMPNTKPDEKPNTPDAKSDAKTDASLKPAADPAPVKGAVKPKAAAKSKGGTSK